MTTDEGPAHLTLGAADGTSITVTVWGSAGPPILALHPGVGDSRIWQWCAPVWAAAGYRVVAYDRRGFGHTRYTAGPHDELEDLRAVTAALGARPAIVVGNSRGGGLALDLALDHPSEVAALVLIAPSPSGYDYDDWPTSPGEADLDDRITRATSTGDLEEINRLEVQYWLDGPDELEGRVDGAPRQLLAEMNEVALRAPDPGPDKDRQPAWPRLGQVAAPTLVIAGQHDLPGIRRQCGEAAAAIPRARTVTVHGSAHCPMLDQPDALDHLLLDFVASLWT